jgi:hypothetical protein
MSKFFGISLLLATVTLAPVTAAGAGAQQFVPDIVISSTVSTNGDFNPYGVAFVPSNFPTGGMIARGDILVSNFNGTATMLQGTGTTIVKLTPNMVTPPMKAATFFTSKLIGLTTALGVMERGFVVVGNLPNPLSAGSLQFIDRNGALVPTKDPTKASSLIDGPWDLTIDDDPDDPTLYVSNVHVLSVNPPTHPRSKARWCASI